MYKPSKIRRFIFLDHHGLPDCGNDSVNQWLNLWYCSSMPWDRGTSAAPSSTSSTMTARWPACRKLLIGVGCRVSMSLIICCQVSIGRWRFFNSVIMFHVDRSPVKDKLKLQKLLKLSNVSNVSKLENYELQQLMPGPWLFERPPWPGSASATEQRRGRRPWRVPWLRSSPWSTGRPATVKMPRGAVRVNWTCTQSHTDR